VRRAINVSGVVLNTGLGRAPVHPEAAQAMAAAARSFCVLEVDRFTGKRNQRDERLSELLVRLTGAEAGIAVNNCAAAVLLTLQTFAGGRSALVSRGELVEIGGSFRMPAVMERAGVRLVEVGTTNRTRIADYEAAIDDTTGLLLKVHTSNYRVVGFTEEAGPAELDELGRRRGIRTAYDLGSGLLDAEGATSLGFLGDEPPLAEALASGMDVAMFSGDKLLGGPQAGLIVGRRQAIAELRKNPLYRALRLDKVALAGLETTLQLLLSGRGDELPARAMLVRPAESLRPVAEALAVELAGLEGISTEVVAERSQPGSGSAPDVYLDTFCVAAAARGRSTQRLAADLRAGDPPVFARIHEDRLLMDVRTLLPGDHEALVEAFRRLA
jgi:L-seryl-tRNA(Ser) seleniumtransferase